MAVIEFILWVLWVLACAAVLALGLGFIILVLAVVREVDWRLRAEHQQKNESDKREEKK